MQPASGDVLQFLKAGIMEVPDVLVVTKADLGDAARRARADLDQALAALGSQEVPVVAVSSAPAAQRHRRARRRARRATAGGSTWRQRRLRARRLSALREFTAEHGESALRALGGRREAERLLAAATRASRSRSSSTPSRGRAREPAARPRAATRRRRPARSSPQAAAARPPNPTAVSFAAQVGILVAVFAAISLIAELAGAANLGTAFGIGEFFFAIALVLVIVKT